MAGGYDTINIIVGHLYIDILCNY